MKLNFFPRRTHIIDQNIYVLPGELVLEGVSQTTLVARNGAGFYTDKLGSLLTIKDCEDLTLDGFTFVGPGPLYEPKNSLYCALVELKGKNNRLTFRNCRFFDGPNHGIAHLTMDRTSHNTLVENCQFARGGNYGRNDASNLIWDGAAIAIGGLGTRIVGCTIKDWTRGVEFENGYSSCSWDVSHCTITDCPHVGIWITPTGCQNGNPTQTFSGRITNCTIGPGRAIQPGFISTGIACNGGNDIIVACNQVHGFPDGCGIQFSADMAPISRLQIMGNSVSSVGRSGILVKNGWENMKKPAKDLICVGNMLSGIVGKPLDIDAGGEVICANNLIVP